MPPGAAWAIGNPASAHCIALGGTELTVEMEGGQGGICLLPDGRAVESWHLFRSTGGAVADSVTPQEPDPGACAAQGASWLAQRDCLMLEARQARMAQETARAAAEAAAPGPQLGHRLYLADQRYAAFRDAQCRALDDLAQVRGAGEGMALHDCTATLDTALADLLSRLLEE